MSALFVLMLITAQSAVSQNTNVSVCLWGRDHSNNDLLNGDFIFQGYFNDAPWYKKQYGTHIFYMWLHDGYWCATAEQPTNEKPSTHARCTVTNSISYPWECGLNQWEVHESDKLGFQTDPDMYCQIGSCPEWDCDAIITDIHHEGCDDTFSVKVASNAWSNLNGDRFFYFNYIGFSWACDASLTYTTENSNLGLLAYAERTWIDATKGSTVSIPFVSPSDQIQQIQCVQNPTENPSSAPSQHTSYPSQHQVIPSELPTINPTLYPSAIPTINPTPYPSTEVHDQSTTAYPKEMDSETIAENDVDLTLVVAIITSMVVCVCALILLIVCAVSDRNKKAAHANVEHVKNTIRELPPQEIAETTKGNTVSMHATQEVRTSGIVLQSVRDAEHRSELKHWLENVVHLAIYYNAFVESGYDTLENVQSITDESQLVRIGVTFKAHRVKIMNHIQTLRSEPQAEGRESISEGSANTPDGNTSNGAATLGGDVIEQSIDDDFIVMGDDEMENGIHATLQ